MFIATGVCAACPDIHSSGWLLMKQHAAHHSALACNILSAVLITAAYLLSILWPPAPAPSPPRRRRRCRCNTKQPLSPLSGCFKTPQVKDIMIENIEKVLDRGEKLDLLVDKTEHLQGEAFAFRREAKRARRVMWWKVSGHGCWGLGVAGHTCRGVFRGLS